MVDPPSAVRVAVFIDAQNMYRGARRAFFATRPVPARNGQFHPVALAALIAARRTEGRSNRTLMDTYIYTGRPDPDLDPRGAEANRRQRDRWAADGATVYSRSLQYLPGRPPVEKGIDVALATDLLRLAFERQIDVAIVCSGDSDLTYAIDTAIDAGVGVEVASWRRGGYAQRIPAGRHPLFCHWLYEDNYDEVRDNTNYAEPDQ